MKAHVDPGLCQGHGLCYMSAPEVFTDDEEGHSVALDRELTPQEVGAAREAVTVCPERAINVVG